MGRDRKQWRGITSGVRWVLAKRGWGHDLESILGESMMLEAVLGVGESGNRSQKLAVLLHKEPEACEGKCEK